MRILLVAPVFSPNNNVAAQRMNFLFDTMSVEHEVEVLVLSDKTSFDGRVKSISKRLFSTSYRAWINRKKIYSLLRGLLPEYDLVVVSLPDYGLLEVVKFCSELDVKCIADLRDQPNLSAVQNIGSSKIINTLVRIKNVLQVKYVYQRLQYADYITVVGSISTSMVETSCCKPVVNVNNGYLLADKKFVSERLALKSSSEKNSLIVGWVGSIYRFRDNANLRQVVDELDALASTQEVILRHWGNCYPELEAYILQCPNLTYENTSNFERESFLTELNVCDCFLLSCSDSLIWEPTTSVFDYLLFNKPVIYSGLHNNEAYNILFNSGVEVVGVNDLVSTASSEVRGIVFDGNTNLYSREYAYTNFKRIVDEVSCGL
ncbi:hypothetical protein AB4140_04670 [Shewanella sp. 10N.286.51.B2]|uniref:hypothetical protein n=1 Tax=Shewanella sp. 10N.286.51.B2 TaxID=3229707 RepID=UPI00354FD4DF